MSSIQSTEFLEQQSEKSHLYNMIGSYAFEFLPLALDNDRQFNHVLALGVGPGTELIGSRMYFGDTPAIDAVDNFEDKTLTPKELSWLKFVMHVSNSRFHQMDMQDVDRVFEVTHPPDLLLIRHPAAMQTEQMVQKVLKRIKPYITYATEHNAVVLCSFFDLPWELNGRNLIAQQAIHIAGKSRVHVFSKTDSKYILRSTSIKPGEITDLKPDFYGLRIN